MPLCLLGRQRQKHEKRNKRKSLRSKVSAAIIVLFFFPGSAHESAVFFTTVNMKSKKSTNTKKQRGGPQALILNLVAWFFLSLYFNSTTQNPHSLKMHHFVIVSFDVERKYDSPI